MSHKLAALALATLVAAGPAPKELTKGARRPNIVVILADDMGYGDVHALNPESKIPTPNLDGLAAAGMTFTDAHSGSAVCTPTRYGLVTGRYCWRTRLTRGVLGGSSPPLINPKRPTVASVLKKAGYRTGCVGKWHLGLGWAKKGKQIDFSKPLSVGPTTYGFDFYYGVPASLDMAPYVYVRNDRVVEPPTVPQPAQGFPAYVRKGLRSPGLKPADTLDDLLGQAVGFIKESAAGDKPFFLYFPLTAPHKPVLPHARFTGKTKLGLYGDFVTQVDWTVGQVLKALDETGAAKDTLVVYTSDNGSFMFRLDGEDEQDHVDKKTIQAFRADRHRSNGRFRGTKADVWEAGHHVPFFARWPGRIKPGSTCEETICLTDVMATAAEIAGAELPENSAEDSFSLLPLMEGKTWPTPRAPVVNHSAAGMFAIRDGKWKLVLGNGSGGRQKPRGKPFAKPFMLFDLSKDIGEQNDLAARETETVERLTGMLDGLRKSGRSRP